MMRQDENPFYSKISSAGSLYRKLPVVSKIRKNLAAQCWLNGCHVGKSYLFATSSPFLRGCEQKLLLSFQAIPPARLSLLHLHRSLKTHRGESSFSSLLQRQKTTHPGPTHPPHLHHLWQRHSEHLRLSVSPMKE